MQQQQQQYQAQQRQYQVPQQQVQYQQAPQPVQVVHAEVIQVEMVPSAPMKHE